MRNLDKLSLFMSSKMSKFILIAQVVISAFVTLNIITKDIGAETLTASAVTPKAEVRELALIDDNSLISVSNPITTQSKKPSYSLTSSLASGVTLTQSLAMTVTAYTSSPEETDDTPFITASGKSVGDGIVANNLLPFGTKVRIPELYGDKIFTVQDRMHYRMGNYKIDIWFPDKTEAKKFGVKKATIEILED